MQEMMNETIAVRANAEPGMNVGGEKPEYDDRMETQTASAAKTPSKG
jgi:hypothetical protein